MDKVLQPGARIDRYGSDYGSFTSLEGTPYEMRAVAPGTDQRPYSVLLDWDILWLKGVEQYAKYQTYFRFAKLQRRAA